MFKCCHIVILCPMWAVVVCALSTSDIIGMCPYLSTQKFIRSMSYDKPVWREASGTDLALQRLRRLSKRRIFMFVYVLSYLIGQLSHFLLCFGAGVTNLNEPPSSLFAPSSLLRVRSWLHPYKGHCEQKPMRAEGVIHVAGHPLLIADCNF